MDHFSIFIGFTKKEILVLQNRHCNFEKSEL